MSGRALSDGQILEMRDDMTNDGEELFSVTHSVSYTSGSYRINLPKHACETLNIERGDDVSIDVYRNALVISRDPD